MINHSPLREGHFREGTRRRKQGSHRVRGEIASTLGKQPLATAAQLQTLSSSTPNAGGSAEITPVSLSHTRQHITFHDLENFRVRGVCLKAP